MLGLTTTFPILALAAIAGLGAASPVDLEERQSSCAPLIHFHLAGTGESGLGIVGNALSRDLPQKVSGAQVRAINYNTAAEYFTTVAAGARTAASAITAAASQCPNAKFSLSGYSKGALVTYQTRLSADVQSKMVAIVNFGDPNQRRGGQGTPINNAACYFSFCNDRDTFCDPPGSLGPHLAYARDGSAATASTDIAGCFNSA